MNTKKIVYIYIKTGLHIGAGKDSVEIGGMDQPFIKDRNGNPYIPGSSLKGKLRTLLELNTNNIEGDGTVHSCDKDSCIICNLFGRSGNNLKEQHKPTRLIFRDIYLSPDKDLKDIDKKDIIYTQEEYKKLEENGKKFFEEKTEISIDRKKGTANTGIRPIERVPSGSLFKGEIIIRNFEGDNENLFKINGENIFDYMKKLLENDYLGGQGTRGHGQVKIWFLDDNDK